MIFLLDSFLYVVCVYIHVHVYLYHDAEKARNNFCGVWYARADARLNTRTVHVVELLEVYALRVFGLSYI